MEERTVFMLRTVAQQFADADATSLHGRSLYIRYL
jgi:hypothetical protein